MQTPKGRTDVVSRNPNHSIENSLTVQRKSSVQMPVCNHTADAALTWEAEGKTKSVSAGLRRTQPHQSQRPADSEHPTLLVPAAKKTEHLRLINLPRTSVIGLLGFLVCRFGFLLFPLCKKATGDFKGSQLVTTER